MADHPNAASGEEHLYVGRARRWSGRPNYALTHLAAGLHPGTALDVGCGEGADCVWLAENGWRVTGVDIVATATRRAAAAAASAGVDIEVITGGLRAVTGRVFDLVTCFYVPLRRGTGDLDDLLALVAPGGSLIVVHHTDASKQAARLGVNVSDLIRPLEIAELLADCCFTIEESGTVPGGSMHANNPDQVLRARRKLN
ncbi:class I SAM-dependent methyltransferase [Corynebacterium sp. CCM 9185]|uniref:Methyltransferase domain-containing protein n=1 Tax=Corynebacterium marambiense TaxID=2765364 RepID=A0ABS0VU58_9CORY|nr:methyltransferase domain-containing protein [Corynebacterium marambiense]MBI9000284.1 methyltransferase domain-containing protein [Corynebacterium marambiense]MCK7663638.1 class I SAM-dependent methyltransferase [Corynebacterium marambiense]MCX7541928.1 methyltransferase domain-containing protein [Corynebacterium marambiense]